MHIARNLKGLTDLPIFGPSVPDNGKYRNALYNRYTALQLFHTVNFGFLYL